MDNNQIDWADHLVTTWTLSDTLMAMTSPDHFTPTMPARRRTGLIAAIAAGALVLVAGTAALTVALTHRSSAKAGPKPLGAAATPSTAPPPTTAAPSPTPPAEHHMGDEFIERDGAAKVGFFGFKQPVATSAPRPDQAGYEWAAADVEVCLLIDGGYVNRLPWYLVYDDHTTINSSGTGYQQFPQPEYPWADTTVPNGRCVRGWIVFSAPIGRKPTEIEHNTQTSVEYWTVS